jgi:protein-tyrosine phosphatase
MTVALSLLNFRDLGGLSTEDGRRLRPGVLYRSEGPASFKDDHRRELTELKIRLVCDLRADVERRVAPNDWTTTARLLNLDVTNDLRTETNEGWNALRHDPSEAGARKAMSTNYAAIPGAIQPHWVALIDAIIEGETPVLVHCTAGKDRTGVLVALLLLLLGVPRQDAIRDYLRSDVFGKNLRVGGSVIHAFEETFGFTPSDATINTMIGVFPEFLEAAFDQIIRDWGSIEAYFEAAGVDAARRDRFRAALLVDAAAA